MSDCSRIAPSPCQAERVWRRWRRRAAAGVDAAGLSLLAGRGEAARDLARRLLMHPDLPGMCDHCTGPASAPGRGAEAVIAETLAVRDVGFAHCPLAAGGELLLAEAVRARGANCM